MHEIKVKLQNVTKDFTGQRGESHIRAVDNISLNIYDGEFFALLGPSGCGKTTSLRMIAGFEYPTTGNIYIDSQLVNDLPPYHRPVNTVFQDYALFPHMSILQNVMFGLRMAGLSRKEAEKRALEALDLVQLPGTARRKPRELSGGQQQRVALARALVKRPSVLLLDEPLGALDLKLRRQMQIELKSMQQQLGITFVFVTHDQEEAMTMANRIAVMEGGKILQVGRPEEIYEKPRTRFVADFIGETNFLVGTLTKQLDQIGYVKLSNSDAPDMKATVDNTRLSQTETVTVAIRPERIIVRPYENCDSVIPENMTCLSGRIDQVYYIGTDIRYMVKIDNDISLSVRVQNTNPDQILALRSDQVVNVYWHSKNARILAN